MVDFYLSAIAIAKPLIYIDIFARIFESMLVMARGPL
jgi:hypothetical protein